MAMAQWFTLVRFNGDPSHLTGVAQARDAREALALLAQWLDRYPDDTTVIFDPENKPVDRAVLEAQTVNVATASEDALQS
ncbi:MAG TPA: hypothetical protein VFD32_22490 [Dehalococcoidia bacterium]|nr:hypothetical protein [Dehalococcoidia bacterium]